MTDDVATTLREIGEHVLPAKQARSRETRDRLLAAGSRLLEQGAFEETSIADFAAEAGCSVGAFYQRFPDKEAFFKVLIEAIMARTVSEAKSSLNLARLADASIDEVLDICVTYWIGQYRSNRGLLKTVVKKTLHSQDAWTPLGRLGLEVVAHLVGLIAARCGKEDSRLFHHRALVGFQFVSSMAFNATMHQTMGYDLDDPELVPWCVEILRHCLFGELPSRLVPDASSAGLKSGALLSVEAARARNLGTLLQPIK